MQGSKQEVIKAASLGKHAEIDQVYLYLFKYKKKKKYFCE